MSNPTAFIDPILSFLHSLSFALYHHVCLKMDGGVSSFYWLGNLIINVSPSSRKKVLLDVN